MKNKVCVELRVPMIERNFDIFIPVNKKTIEIVFLLNSAINEMTDGNFPMNNHLSLIDGRTGAIYKTDLTIKENQISNGSKLILL
ncbi:MAG: hypothetical protein IJO27_00660 [Bacilli bacterium]|nr:hypothetical protein [Bacilli bacterium]